MTVYTLLEEQAVQKKPSYKKWCIVGVSLTAVAVAGYLIFSYQHNKSDQDAVPELNTTIPARSINFTVPTQEQLYFVDLDKYTIEDNLIQTFQKNTVDHIKRITIEKLLQLHYKNQTAMAWKDRWLSHSTDTEKSLFSCDNQPLPYPILRHLAKEYFPIQNADGFYDDDDNEGGTGFNYTSPTLILPFAKQPKLVQGQELCIRIIVPYRNVGKDDIHRLLYRPYPQNNAQLTSPWWDTMMTTLTDKSTNASIPIHMQPWREHRNLRLRARDLNHVNNQIPEWTRLREDELYERERTHIYEAQINLPHQGSWELSSILEFVEARYNFEYGPVSPYTPIQIPVFPTGLEYINITANTQKQKQPIGDLEILKQHLSLPLCKGFNNPGRWLPFPKNSSQLSDDALAQVSGLTRDGKYWAPYSCRLRHLSYEQFNRCASKKYARGINLYGDSNIRRSIKKFLSHGQWCKNWEQHITSPLLPDNEKPIINSSFMVRRDEPAKPVDDGSYASPRDYRYTEESQTRSCYCEDFSENHWDRAWFDPMARRFDLVYSNNEAESKALGITEWDDKPANGSTAATVHNDSFRVSSYKWDGLTYLNIPNWDEAVPTSPREVDVAIFSLGNWDAAFAELEPFLRDVDRLIRQIKDFYDLTKTKIIYRTAQYYCCRIDVSGRTRQVSGPRMESFEQEVQARFKNELKADIWDTYTLGESRTWDEKIIGITCPSNHVPADQVDIENQILMNGLCNL
ncbi:hypothetical protein HMPREF1544_03507 [Mucor circinelloides 1006PhL]|uniref:Uncharacterized protein n=1 Tax=Mucor circinelloides f. circinelloides (strain 1006PhL) TaxID=1220926 RepID=S2JMG8_MUCC1|nr:hypothetical protein HMPREF1544_03507 [Mucor circinelloides 1006PhL]